MASLTKRPGQPSGNGLGSKGTPAFLSSFLIISSVTRVLSGRTRFRSWSFCSRFGGGTGGGLGTL
eukprot:11194833-Lingulodinium_polyedra.AAC.1